MDIVDLIDYSQHLSKRPKWNPLRGLLLRELQPKQIWIYSRASGNVIKLLCDLDWILVDGFQHLNPENVQKASSADLTWL